MAMQTEYTFSLPRGFVDATGQVHRQGQMRLAIALDEIEAARDPRVQTNAAFLPVLLLSRVVTRLGDLPAVTPQVLLGLFAADLFFLEELYQQLNSPTAMALGVTCPQCNNHFQIQLAPTP